MVAALPRPHSEPSALQYLSSTRSALPCTPLESPIQQATVPDSQIADVLAESVHDAAPPPRRSISSFNPFALPVTDAAVEALRPYRRISMSTKRRQRTISQCARQGAHVTREREPVTAPSQVDVPPPQRDSLASNASASTRKSSGSRSGRDGPASLWDHVVVQAQSGLQSAHTSALNAALTDDVSKQSVQTLRRSSDDSERLRYHGTGAAGARGGADRARSFMQTPDTPAGNNSRPASEPIGRASNDSEHSAAAAALCSGRGSATMHCSMDRQASSPKHTAAVLALLQNSQALHSCSNSATGDTDTDGGSLTSADHVTAAVPTPPNACFTSALYATTRHTRPSAPPSSKSSDKSAPFNTISLSAASTDFSSAPIAASQQNSVFGSMSAVGLDTDALQARGGSASSDHTDTARATEQAAASTPGQSAAQRTRDQQFKQELDVRVGRARQTMDYAASQRCRFSRLQIATLTVWEALDLFNELDKDLITQQTPAETAFLACEWCVHEFPEYEWAPLLGLVHDMGRLLAHPLFGAEPLWSVSNEAYPLGCEFSEHISGSQFLTACPDRRCSCYKGPTGVYHRACGLDSVHFTWTGTEYLTMVLLLNQTRLPFEAIFLLRFQNFYSAIAHGAYGELCSERDLATLPLLRRFSRVLQHARAGIPPPGARISHAALAQQCQAAIGRYFAAEQLHW